MKKKVKIIGGIILALLAAGGGGAAVMAPLTLETTVLEESDARVTFTEQGSYVYDQSVTVYPQISGEVAQVVAQRGQSVKKGDVLAVISASDYEYQIKTLESGIAGYEAQIANLQIQERDAKNQLHSARETLLGQIAEVRLAIAQYDKTEKSLDRQLERQMDIIAQNRGLVSFIRDDLQQAKEDYHDDIITKTQYNMIREQYAQANNALDMSVQQYEQLKSGEGGRESLESQRDSLEAQLAIIDTRLAQNGVAAMRDYYGTLIESARHNIESMTEKLGQAEITAPIDGVIESLPVSDANVVSQAAAVAIISARPVAEVYVPIREIDGVQVGDEAELILDKRIGDVVIPGQVEHIDEEAEIKISALGVEERKIRVLIRPLEEGLKIGYAMDVKFIVFQRPGSIVVPKTAIFEKDGHDMVWAVEDGAARLREVQKIVETRDGYAVTGLGAGEMIITDANIESIKEGKKIKPE